MAVDVLDLCAGGDDQAAHGMVYRRILGNGVVGTFLDLDHGGGHDLAEVGVHAAVDVAVVLLDGGLQILGLHGGEFALDRESIDQVGQLFQSVSLQDAALRHAGVDLFLGGKGHDRLGEDGVGGDEARIFGGIGAYVAAVALIDVAVALSVHIDDAVGLDGEGPHSVLVQHAGVGVHPGIALDVAHLHVILSNPKGPSPPPCLLV